MSAPKPVHRVAIALGSSLDSSLGTRAAHLASALVALSDPPRTKVLARSSVYRTDPVGPPGIDPAALAAQPEYLNAAAVILTTLSPRSLLDRLLEIERSRGRDRSVEGRWGPRTLDLDLLLYDGLLLDEPGLSIPHPRMTQRAFVLIPLAEIAPEWVVPGRGNPAMTIREHAAALPSEARRGVRSPSGPAVRIGSAA